MVEGKDATQNRLKPLLLDETWWARQVNAFRYWTGHLSKKDGERYVQLEECYEYGNSLKQCEARKQYLLEYSPTIRFLLEKVNALGGNVNGKHFRCCFCAENLGGGFDRQNGIMLCANKLISQRHQEQVMAHELIHAYDHLRFKVDWRNPRHLACTEIRAAALSAECGFMQQFWLNQQFKIVRGYQDCVRRRAILSVMTRNPGQDVTHAAEAVDQVWDSCLTDTRPFDEVYK